MLRQIGFTLTFFKQIRLSEQMKTEEIYDFIRCYAINYKLRKKITFTVIF